MSAAFCCRPPVTSSDSAGPVLVKCQSLVHETCPLQGMVRTLYLNLKREKKQNELIKNIRAVKHGKTISNTQVTIALLQNKSKMVSTVV